MTYQQALAWLEGLLNYERAPMPYAQIKLNRIRALLGRLGNPHTSLRTVLVAGTKGKGSTAAMMAAVLQESGERVGLYSKPHLVDFRERIRVGDVLVSEETLADLVAEVRPAVEAGDADPWGRATYFEVSVALALLYFLRERVHRAILEVGIGGRLDATNVCDPELSVITPISYDHTDLLGNTLREIASEKVGIARRRGTVVTAPQLPEPWEVLHERCRELGAHLIEVGRDVRYEIHRVGLDGVDFTVETPLSRYEDLHVPLLGRHQAVNAAVAVTAVEELLRREGRRIAPEVVRAGLARLSWPARQELLSFRPAILVDVAHNPASMAALRDTLKELFPGRRVVLVLGMIATHDPDPVAQLIVPLAEEVITTTPQDPRALPADALAEVARRYTSRVLSLLDPQEALASSLRRLGEEDLLVVTGSFYLAGPLREALLRSLRSPVP
ncbi:MAG: folylpolyglutamate synthase/dihydrofolate synthase family protein [Armatimonadota bacterium]|nr:folylpolyglutamate synthase/dihydrofolate synthase family protein [Armatimonadota bacterium]MDR7439625.1 folylpolyglutamate synthase/dihydrofolate synthase family protein [Armatimonadota bacterium]MDR7562816.1 folylpolyglutamate synthase/dihydrofolate synthase family protein [Armatimonadota bacterium]MDR7567708.1 folylpolyglutamate synthase/dihydrofolate synthase family protein [Armatimonadota bacterium]MDR7601739.1 folylpolyglutamate synthase/dihydrofolate synthase family protein [Armatimon